MAMKMKIITNNNNNVGNGEEILMAWRQWRNINDNDENNQSAAKLA
jgi:hypothetical protein